MDLLPYLGSCREGSQLPVSTLQGRRLLWPRGWRCRTQMGWGMVRILSGQGSWEGDVRWICCRADVAECGVRWVPRSTGRSYTAWFGGRGRGAPGRSSLVVVAVHCWAKELVWRLALSASLVATVSFACNSGVVARGVEIFASFFASVHQWWLPSAADEISLCFRCIYKAFAERTCDVQWFRNRVYFDQSTGDRLDRAFLKRRNFVFVSR